MARTAAARLAVLAVLSGACAGGGDREDRSDAAPPAAPFRSALIGDPAPPQPPFLLTLTSPGAEPRRELRYRVPPGAHERMRFALTNVVEVFIAGRRVQRMAPPTIEMSIEVEVTPRPGGGYRCTAWINDTASADWERMAPGQGSELRKSLEKLRGHHISFEVDDRGHPLSNDITLPETLDSHRGEALGLLEGAHAAVVPFPAEPVGVGAVWTVTDSETGRTNLAGAVVATYTLVAMRGERLELSMALSLPQDPAPLSLTGKEVSGYSGSTTTGAVRVVVDLGHLMPDSDGTIDIDLEGRTFTGSEELPFRFHQQVRPLMDSK
jgi:hypothetical protein